MFDESIPSLLEPPTTGVTTRTVTEDPPPLTVSFRFPVAPALVAPDTADIEMAEPQVPGRLHLPTQNVRFTNDNILHTDELPNFIASDTDTSYENSVYISNFPTANDSGSSQIQSFLCKFTYFL